MEVLRHDVVESILERVPVKSLLRFKSVSKQWQSIVESKNFQERQLLIRRQQSPVPDLLFVTMRDPDWYYYSDDTKDTPSSSLFSYSSVDDNDDDHYTKIISSSIKVHIKKWFGRSNSCDGLVCLCNNYESIIINPTTRWHRTFSISNLQKQHQCEDGWRGCLGFGKDKFNGIYKSIWLYNLDNKKTITTCEVFDFRNNAWRYVTCPASPYHIITPHSVHLEGSIHWLTKCELEIQVLSFDLHTETFQFTAKAPFAHAHLTSYEMSNLNNGLCVAVTKYPKLVIWLFDSGNKTWNHTCSIDLDVTYSLFKKSYAALVRCIGSLKPLAVLEEKNEKKKVLFYFLVYSESSTSFVLYDGQPDSFDFTFRFNSLDLNYHLICCFQSLISDL